MARRTPYLPYVAAVILITALAGCKRDEAQVYHVSKDDSPPPQAAEVATPEPSQPAMGLPTAAEMALPKLNYQVPSGWKEKPPSEMRVASFDAPGPNGQAADVSVIPLAIVGRDLELVNMWRSQVQLPPTSDPDAVKKTQPVAIGAEQGRLFDFTSDQTTEKSRPRMLMGVLTRGSMSWFFKMTGEDAVVSSQKEKFLQFLKSVSFAENAPAPTASAPAIPHENSR